MNKDAREEVLILKNDYQEDNSYLIPYIYEEIENSIEPIEYYFNINDNLILDINYKFIIFKNKDFKDIIFSKLTEKEREKLKDWTISKTTYFLIEYKEEDKLFYLNANLVLEK